MKTNIFPKYEDETKKFSLRSTYVMFDAEDFSIPDPLLFKKNIVTAIEKEGYRGRIKINGYFGLKITIPQDLLDQYLEAGIYSKIFEGDRVARMNMMLVELLFWAMSHYPAGTNVLIITKNQKILEEHKVRDIIEALAVRDFYFAIEHPDTFYPPAACAESSELFIPIATRKRTFDG
ncbi:BnaC07g03030D [Brassica napus]|uniref:BnaC07g03030D protein n=1 Tax=Brassica napus TaxID=3708 RepID=A0A078FJ54_BRANA|nr:BnaC07g03030D [Brassica napus]